jgi:ElaB/YqjD/DUF883 family membrane-anchored ribosome-binding protein
MSGRETCSRIKHNSNKSQTIMENQHQKTGNDMGTLADDARALIAATADVAGDQVAEARQRLAAALESGKEIYGRARERAVDSAQAADKAVRENPYQIIGIAFGIGVILGFLASRRGCSHQGD